MTKVLRCGDMMPGCEYVARAESEDELMQKAAEHAREAHGIQTVPADLVQQIKSKIRDE
jgi:predicted small metal-binding protein